MMCPELYEKAWMKAYNERTGYKIQKIGKWTRGMKKLELDVIKEKIAEQNTDQSRSRNGDEKDLMKYWEAVYERNAWK